MLEKNTKKCPLNDEIVSYMYGELHGRASEAFETHLADCSVCTDEFAAVSNVRFSVYEWQKEAFAPLPTPHFSVPYETVPPAADTAPGVFAGLRELLGLGRWPVTVAAGVVLVLGVGIIAVSLVGSTEQQIANMRQTEPTARQTAPVVGEPVAVTREEAAPVAEKPEVAVAAERRPAKAARATHVEKVKVQEPQKKSATAKAPGLTDFDDDADTSLRLADLFDGIGS